MNDILNKGIEDLELSMRSINALGMMGCKTIGDVARCEERELKRTPNLGKMSIREIKETLKNLGLQLGMEKQPQPPKKTLINDLNMDLILKVAEAFKKSSEKITAKKTCTWEEIDEHLGEHEKIVKIYRDQMWNYFHR